jgi:deoxyribonuclease V
VQIHTLHPWNVTEAEAIKLQRELAARVVTSTPVTKCDLIAGADVSYNKYSTRVFAAVVVLRAADWSIVETQTVVGESHFPYVPGLLSFREAPVVLQAFAQVQSEPDVIMLDGQGLAHPRRFGLACHIGLCLEKPCLGCAKSLFVGKFADLGAKAGSTADLVDRGEVVGQALRTKNNVNPVYVSAGHKIDLASAVRWSLAASQGYRIPEPTRQAHIHVNDLRREVGEEPAGPQLL